MCGVRVCLCMWGCVLTFFRRHQWHLHIALVPSRVACMITDQHSGHSPTHTPLPIHQQLPGDTHTHTPTHPYPGTQTHTLAPTANSTERSRPPSGLHSRFPQSALGNTDTREHVDVDCILYTPGDTIFHRGMHMWPGRGPVRVCARAGLRVFPTDFHVCLCVPPRLRMCGCAA